jgi:hypothetical protein
LILEILNLKSIKTITKIKVDTIGFRLASNKVTLTDSDGAVHSLYTASNGTVLSANLVGASMNQTNLANIVSSDSSTGISPTLSFALDSIPAKEKPVHQLSLLSFMTVLIIHNQLVNVY